MNKKIVGTCIAVLTAGFLFAAPAKSSTTAKTVEMVVIESPDYEAGQEDRQVTAGIGQFFQRIPTVRKVTAQQAAADEKLREISYDFLPLYLVKKTEGIREKLAEPLAMGQLEETEEYILLPHQTRLGVYVGKKANPNVMELFVMSQCPYGVMAENKIIAAQKEGKIPTGKNIRIRYIVSYHPSRGFSSLHGSGEWEEDVRQLLIAKYYPSKLWKYLEIRNKDYRSSRWDKAMQDAGINVNKIISKFDSEGLELLKAEAEYGQEYGIGASPTFLWEGQAQLDFVGASRVPGFEFLNPSSNAGVPADIPAGSC
ncbi:MAG: hypothetical protein J5601_06635 [Elusimicrobiaceae bacterium]|nr:hypothetical protein [Elusimicrobiaceae bacterium]